MRPPPQVNGRDENCATTPNLRTQFSGVFDHVKSIDDHLVDVVVEYLTELHRDRNVFNLPVFQAKDIDWSMPKVKCHPVDCDPEILSGREMRLVQYRPRPC